MQPHPGFPTPAASTPKPASTTLFRLAVASILCWAVAPVGLIAGLLSRRDSLRRGEPVKGHAWLAIVLGGIGTAIMFAAYLADTIPTWLHHEHPKAIIASATTSASAALPSASNGPTPEAQEQARARAADSVQHATELARDKSKLDANMTKTETALAAKQVGAALRSFDGLSSAFGSLEPTDLGPGDETDPGTRATLADATALLHRYKQLQKDVEASEMLVFDAAFNKLWDPKNAQRDEAQLYASVGSKFGMSGAEVQAVYRRHETAADERLKATADAEASALEAQCGPKPHMSPVDGGSIEAEEFVKRTANDPGSVDVERCTDPVLKTGACWMTKCDVRGKNAFGAEILNEMEFTFRNRQVVSSRRL
ncbi:MAG: DUF4190 domain-containing protein [Pseudomonadota bacterium]